MKPCGYCDMALHSSGKLSWMQGQEHDDGYHVAHIENDGDIDSGLYNLYVENMPLGDQDVPESAILPISNCPWCGRRL